MKLILSFFVVFICFAQDDLNQRFNSLVNRDPQVKALTSWYELLSELEKDDKNLEKSAYILNQLVTKARQEQLTNKALQAYKKIIQRADKTSPKALLNRANFCHEISNIDCEERSLAEIITAYPQSEQALSAKSLLFKDSKVLKQSKAYHATIVLDPGHGGDDAGAVANNLIEKDFVLDVTLRVKELLESDNMKVVLTRSTDKFVPLLDRAQKANDYDANLLVSIHGNAGSAGKCGFEFYYYDESKISDLSERENSQSLDKLRQLGNINKKYPKEKSRGLAAQLSNSFELIFGKNYSYLINGSRFYVLQESEMPAVLLELLYLDNPEHAEELNSSKFRQSLAEGIANGITEYLNA